MINRMTIEAMKKSEAMHTIDGPVGVSKMYAAFNPKMAEDIPIRDAATAIISGVETIERAEAAGMINMEIINKTPTTLIPCLLYTSPSPRDRTRSRMPSSA